jgi:hypothetical protein
VRRCDDAAGGIREQTRGLRSARVDAEDVHRAEL